MAPHITWQERQLALRLRAAKAVGKLPEMTKEEADDFYDRLFLVQRRTQTIRSARRVEALAAAVYDRYILKGANVSHVNEWRRGEWFRWTIVNGYPVEFRKLDPQPEAPPS